MNKVSLYVKDNQSCIAYSQKVSFLLKQEGFEIDDENPNVVITIGGDGTFLRAVHHYIDRVNDILFVGINAGHLGFFMEVSVEDIEPFIKSLKEKTYRYTSHALLHTLIKSAVGNYDFYAVNEIRIENPFHTLIAEVKINDEMLETFRGNGLVVSSSLGSSAYNKSLGGAVVDNSLDIMELTEIATIQNTIYHSLGSSLVLSKDKKIEFSGNFNDVVVGYDFETFSLTKATSLLIELSDKRLSIIRYKNSNNIVKLRESFIK